MGDQIPWHHLQGLHVVLITIIQLPQTPQLFQFLSAQNPEYVTLFSFCKKLFCMKNSQQIKAISLKKMSLWVMVKGILGRPPVQEVRAALPSFLLTDGTGPTVPTLNSQQGWQWRLGAHAFPQKTLWVRLWTPYSCRRWVIHSNRKASQCCHWIRKQACRER